GLRGKMNFVLRWSDLLKKGVAMKATISGLSSVLLALALTGTTQAWFGFGSKCASPAPPVDATNTSLNPASADGSCPSGAKGCHGLFCGAKGCHGLFCKHLFHGGLFQHLGLPKPLGFGGPPFARSPRDYFMVDP